MKEPYRNAVNMINRWGTAVGFAETDIPDPACPAPQILHFLPAVWRDGKVRRLPTYSSDPDGLALAINDRGQIVGSSGTCTTFQPTLINLVAFIRLCGKKEKPLISATSAEPQARLAETLPGI